MRNQAGVTRSVKVGLSWVNLFFGGIPFFFRGMPIHGAIGTFLMFISFWISNLILWWVGNRMTVLYYLDIGYTPIGDNWADACVEWGLDIDLP